jgi:hypothetical protein
MSDDWLSGAPMDPIAVSLEPLPTLPGCDFLHPGQGVVIVGPTGRGRSSLAQAMMYDAARAGVPCAYLGCEVTQGEFNARAAVLSDRRGDLIDDELRAQLAGVRYLDLPSTMSYAWAHPVEWIELVSERYQLVFIDPLSAVASALGLDFDTSNADYSRWYDRLIQPLVTAGVTMVGIDNVGHADEAKARAKGASAKQDKPDLTFSCSLSTAPSGLLIRAGKVRTVRAAFQRDDEWIFVKDTQRVVPRDRAGEDRPAFRPTKVMERVSRVVEQDGRLSANAICTAVGGRKANVTLAIQLLLSEGYLSVEEDGQAHYHHSVKPYRETTRSTGSGPVPNQVPEPAAPTGSTGSPPLKEGPGTGPGGKTHEDSNRVSDADAELERVSEKFGDAEVLA